MVKKYDYLIIGSGLFGAVFAYMANKRGKKCIVLEKRNHIGGNVYTEKIQGINVHKYGAHIFHTSNKRVWDFVNSFIEFNRFTNSPLANYKGKLFNLPFNMNTFYQLWGVKTPIEAKRKIEEERAKFKHITSPQNLEEQALILGGRDIYKKLIKGYTEKQWGRSAKEIPAFIIKRLPFRFNYDNNYFNDLYQGIPIGGYTNLIEKLLAGIDIKLGLDYFSNKKKFNSMGKKVVYSGKIDQYFNYIFGKLEYRSLHFENKLLNIDNFQGNAVINYTEKRVPYTRIIEHKHFEFGTQNYTYITYEYPHEYSKEGEPYYPINDEKNQKILFKYQTLAKKEKNVTFGGRLAEYKYYDMHNIIERVFQIIDKELYD